MSSKHQPQSPLKRAAKQPNQAEHQQSKKAQYNMSKSPFMTEGQKINFQSQDSEGSDISYESSIQSQDDINIGQIQYFKEEMGRFFINYPELINHAILDYREATNDRDDTRKQEKLSNNWALISDQILTQAKDSCSFLESLSHRIALYRSKIHQEDLIDVLLKEEKNIMKEIQLEINLKKKQSKGVKNTMMELTEGSQNVYFSYRKKKQIQNKMNLHREQNQNSRKPQNPSSSQHLKATPKTPNRTTFRDRANTLSNNKLTGDAQKSLSKKNSEMSNARGNFFLTSNQNAKQPQLQKNNSKTFHTRQQKSDSKTASFYPSNTSANKRPNSLNKGMRLSRQNEHQKTVIQENEKETKTVPNCQSQAFWKHLVNFEPRTEAGRQLCELIRRTSNPNDELGIRKTIMQFLVRNRDTVQNEIVLKSTISQKIQKLYNDDSKQLLMFYPTKMTVGQAGQGKEEGPNNDRQAGLGAEYGQSSDGGKYQGNNSNADNGMDLGNRLFGEGEKFMSLLQDIVEGPLMKYWMMLQENKL